MKPCSRRDRAGLALAAGSPVASSAGAVDPGPEDGFVSLFNGTDLAGWKVPEGDNGHWKVVDGVIDYDARSEAKGDKNLVSEKEYGDFVLKFDWRIKDTPWINPNIPYVLPDGTHAKGRRRQGAEAGPARQRLGGLPPRHQDGQEPGQHLVLADRLGRGLRLPDRPEDARLRPRRGHPQAPGRQAGRGVELLRDHPHEDRLTVVLNGITVIENAQLPGIPERGPDRLPAPRRLQGREVLRQPQPGPVPERPDQAAELTMRTAEDSGVRRPFPGRSRSDNLNCIGPSRSSPRSGSVDPPPCVASPDS